MQHHQDMRESLSRPALLMLFCLVDEPKTATALHEAVVQATGQVSEPGAFSRVVTRLEQGGWIIASNGREGLRLYHLTAQGMLALQQAEEKYRRNQEDQQRNTWSSDLLLGLVQWILLLLPFLLIGFTITLAQARNRRARVHLWLALPVTLAMIAVSVACALWYFSLWQMLPQFNPYSPYTPTGLLLGLIGMGLATILALVALIRAMFALRAQTVSQFEQSAGVTYQGPSLSVNEKNSSKLWKGVLAVLLLVFLLPWPSLFTSDAPSFQDLLQIWLFAGIVGGVTALLVMVLGDKIRRMSRQPGDKIAIVVKGALLFCVLLAISLPLQLSRFLFVSIDGGQFVILFLLSCICIIPALIVRTHAINVLIGRAQQLGSMSPKVWIIILPVWFLVFCMEIEYLIGPDYNSFGISSSPGCLRGWPA